MSIEVRRRIARAFSDEAILMIREQLRRENESDDIAGSAAELRVKLCMLELVLDLPEKTVQHIGRSSEAQLRFTFRRWKGKEILRSFYKSAPS